MLNIYPSILNQLFFLIYFFETGSHYVAQADLKFTILLPQSPQCWDYRDVLLQLVPFILEM
jgi:hypothetical protein